MQNTDDAGATLFKLFLETAKGAEDNHSRSYLSPGFNRFSGTSLFCYNDGLFLDKDFDAIRNMGAYSKQSDAIATGKFGLGFTAVYHMTDLPQFLSGEYLCVIDPHQELLKGKDGQRMFAPRWRLSKLRPEIRDRHLADFSPLLKDHYDEEKLFFYGTAFRFPLRTSAQVSLLRLVQKEYTPKDMANLIRSYQEDTSQALWPLKNILEIQFISEYDCGSPMEFGGQSLYSIFFCFFCGRC